MTSEKKQTQDAAAKTSETKPEIKRSSAQMGGFRVTTTTIPLGYFRPRSLAWRGDELIDWVGGGARLRLDGQHQRASVGYAFDFDAAVASKTGAYAAIFQRLGTKGLLLDEGGKIVRELNRSFYQANVYEYPIALFPLPSGREVIVHCPESYCRIEIEDAQTGERLTKSETRKDFDRFVSRLRPDRSGRRFCQAGWIWQPWDTTAFFDTADVLRSPALLDSSGIGPIPPLEMIEAAFGSDDKGLVVLFNEEYKTPLPEECRLKEVDKKEADRRGEKARTSEETQAALARGWGRLPFEVALGEEDFQGIGPYLLGTWDFEREAWENLALLSEPTGPILPLSPDVLIAFYKAPRMIDRRSGEVLGRFDDLPTDDRCGSILWHKKDPFAVYALDPEQRRFAIVCGENLCVVTFEPSRGEGAGSQA